MSSLVLVLKCLTPAMVMISLSNLKTGNTACRRVVLTGRLYSFSPTVYLTRFCTVFGGNEKLPQSGDS